MTRKQKSAEIQRFLQLLDALNETPATLEEKTGISSRTINNYIWGDTPLGGSLLRVLSEQFGVSIDWILTGNGSLFANNENVSAANSRLLMPFFETIDANTVQDFWWLAARAVEESLRQSGAVAGDDYGYVDLYQLSQPLVAAKFAAGELVLQAHESAGK
jgi:transcriptional regulator with XRE-family HTH domain